ncbi:MAG: AMMECR1 domain-containing protein [bacterium]
MNRLSLFSSLILTMTAALPAPGFPASVLIVPSPNPGEALQAYTEWAKGPEGPALLAFVRTTVSALAAGEPLPATNTRFPWLDQAAGVFVTAMKGRQVRACVGTFAPTGPTLGDEIAQQCRRLVSEDPRHPPLDPYELDALRFVVTFTGAARHLDDPEAADIWREGLIARWNGREAVLLPGEAKTLSWGLSFLHRQMKKPKEEPAVYAAFPVVVVSEPWRRSPADAKRGEKKKNGE